MENIKKKIIKILEDTEEYKETPFGFFADDIIELFENGSFELVLKNDCIVEINNISINAKTGYKIKINKEKK